MAEEIAALERTSTWDIVPIPPTATLITCKWIYKIKTHQMVLLNILKRVLLHVAFSWSMDVTTRRRLLLLLIGPPFTHLLRWPQFVGGLSLSLM